MALNEEMFTISAAKCEICKITIEVGDKIRSIEERKDGDLVVHTKCFNKKKVQQDEDKKIIDNAFGLGYKNGKIIR